MSVRAPGHQAVGCSFRTAWRECDETSPSKPPKAQPCSLLHSLSQLSTPSSHTASHTPRALSTMSGAGRGKGKTAGKKAVSRSSKAGLQFPVGRIARCVSELTVACPALCCTPLCGKLAVVAQHSAARPAACTLWPSSPR